MDTVCVAAFAAAAIPKSLQQTLQCQSSCVAILYLWGPYVFLTLLPSGKPTGGTYRACAGA